MAAFYSLEEPDENAASRRPRPRRRSMWSLPWLIASALAFVMGAQAVSPFTKAELMWMDPGVVREAMTIKITLQLTCDVLPYDLIRIKLGGITSGDAKNAIGRDLNSDETVVWDDGVWSAVWNDGSVAAMYMDSYITLKKLMPDTLLANTEVVIYVDSFTKLKANCGIPGNIADFSISTDTASASSVEYEAITAVTSLAGSCYVTDSEIKFKPALPNTDLEITVYFTPSRAITAGDVVTLNLAGFTSGLSTGIPGSNIADGALVLKPIGYGHDGTVNEGAAVGFTGAWNEATTVAYSQHQPGYTDSQVVLTALTTFPAATQVAFVISRWNGIKAQCGMLKTHPGVTVAITTSDTLYYDVAPVEFEKFDPIGAGCKSLGGCTGHGQCDACMDHCDCQAGWGHADDLPYPFISPRCDERVCPTGIDWAASPESKRNGHPVAECSGAGLCDRTRGKCICFDGWSGVACERMLCPSVTDQLCSGHGRCLSMDQMARVPAALPLSPVSVSHNESGTQTVHYEHAGSRPFSNTQGHWDANAVMGCVCDSSWSVGLGSGETQQPEWFGPACQDRRCPGGDDPTTNVDETDCNGVLAEGGRGTGLAGNLCHHDCSGQGQCDQLTGMCRCFPGRWGSNCGRSDVRAKGGV